jgi:thiol:disulfide interchange protein DsbD
MIRPIALTLALLIASPVPAPVQASESTAFRSPQSVTTLVADVAAVGPGEAFRLGLRIIPAAGWHTYWRNPGDAGAPPELALTLPQGATAGPIAWPAPERIDYAPLVNFGYKSEVLLPLPVQVPAAFRPGDAFTISAEAHWLICAEVCIPESATFQLTLPVGPRAVPSFLAEPWFEAASAAQPRPWIGTASAGAAPGQATLTLAAPFLSRATVQDAFFFPEAPGLLQNAAPQPLTVEAGRITLALATEGTATALAGTVVLRDGGGQRAAFDVSAPVTGPPAGGMALGLPLAIGFALLGGLILNLMPCVFPVLAMKAIGLARLTGEHRGRVRAHAASTVAGMVLSFVALGGALVALRAGGVAAGWGFQFTDPAFVAVMAWLTLAVGLNLSGVFAVGGIAAGQGVAGRGGHAGAFATGVLAVLLAAPCTAPFMAAALGAAAVLPIAQAMAVFTALGAGMALPYALLAAFPALARALPRPGAWMEVLRQGLAFPMYATAAWLVWVLAAQSGTDGVLLGLMGGVVLAAGLWALGLAQRAGAKRARIAGRALAGLAVIAMLALLPRPSGVPAAAAAPEAGVEAWSEARVEALRAAGRPVFVNATAAWCISCQVNDRVALRAHAVQAAFARDGVVYLKADWTRGDPAIGALLRAHGRDGVPLYLYWAPGAATPTVLPQILTEGVVLAALAGG